MSAPQLAAAFAEPACYELPAQSVSDKEAAVAASDFAVNLEIGGMQYAQSLRDFGLALDIS